MSRPSYYRTTFVAVFWVRSVNQSLSVMVTVRSKGCR